MQDKNFRLLDNEWKEIHFFFNHGFQRKTRIKKKGHTMACPFYRLTRIFRIIRRLI